MKSSKEQRREKGRKAESKHEDGTVCVKDDENITMSAPHVSNIVFSPHVDDLINH